MDFRYIALSVLLLIPVMTGCAATNAAEPGWAPFVIARGEERQIIRSLPIEQRPYRPLHFYGNTVRRILSRHAAAELRRANRATGSSGPRSLIEIGWEAPAA
jgi:hypothetical protein